jgi:hypothetical protein
VQTSDEGFRWEQKKEERTRLRHRPLGSIGCY